MGGELSPKEATSASDQPQKTDAAQPQKSVSAGWNVEAARAEAAAKTADRARASERDRVRDDYGKLPEGARRQVATLANTLFWANHPERMGRRIDPRDSEDVAAWWKAVGDAFRIGGKEHGGTQARDAARAGEGKERSAFQPSWAFGDRGKRAILDRCAQLVDDVTRRKSSRVTFRTAAVARMSADDLRQLENGLQSLHTGREAARLKDLGYYDLAHTTLDAKVLASLETGKVPDYRPLVGIEKQLSEVLDGATLATVKNAAFEDHRQFTRNWGALTTTYRAALKEESASEAELTKEAEARVSKLIGGIRARVGRESFAGTRDVDAVAGEQMRRFADGVLASLRAPTADTFRAVQRVLDQLAERGLDDNLAAALLREDGGATDSDLRRMLRSPHGGKELVARLYDTLTARNLWSGDEEKHAASEITKAMASITRAPHGEVMKIPFETAFMDGAYVTAELVAPWSIRLKLSTHVRAHHPEARLLPEKVFTTGLIVSPDTLVGIRYYDDGGKGGMQYVPALSLLNLQKHSRDALFSNYFTSAMVAASIATLGMSGAAAEAAGTAEAAGRVTTTAKLIETGGMAVTAADHAALGVFGTGLAAKEARSLIDAGLGAHGRHLVHAIEKLEEGIGYYGMGRLGVGAVKTGVGKVRARLRDCESSASFGELTSTQRESLRQVARNLDELERASSGAASAGSAGPVAPGAPRMAEFASTRTIRPPTRDLRPLVQEGGHQGYLGEVTYQRARALGMSPEDMIRYVDNGVFKRALASHLDRYQEVRGLVQQAVREDLSKLESVGAATEIQRGIRYGLNPSWIVDTVDNLRARGLSNARIRQHLHNQNEAIDYLRAEFGIHDIDAVRGAIRGAENVENALSVCHWNRNVLEWNVLSPRLEPGGARLGRWADEAREFARERFAQFMNRPLPARAGAARDAAPPRAAPRRAAPDQAVRAPTSPAEDAALRPTVLPDDGGVPAPASPPASPVGPPTGPRPPSRAELRSSRETRPTGERGRRSDQLEDWSEPERFYLQDPVHPRLKAVAHVEHGELCLVVRTELENGTRARHLRGREAFHGALQHFGTNVTAIRGSWTYGSNLRRFNQMVAAERTPQEAALATWTGRRAAEAGFTRVVLRELSGPKGRHDKVVAIFTRP